MGKLLKTVPLILFLAICFVAGLGLRQNSMTPVEEGSLETTSASNYRYQLPDLGGNPRSSSEWQDKLQIVNFWASWCGPCRQEMPLLDRLHQRYVDTGFAVLGINVEGEEAPARELIDRIPVTFPVLIDEGQRVSELYKLEAMPSTVVVDRDGVVRYIHRGYKPGDEAKYVEVVKELIRE